MTLISPSTLPNAFFERQPGAENAIEIENLRVQFSIEKHVKSDPNKCEITITNLAERTRALCEKRPLAVWLDAGYDGVLRQVFTGDVHYAYSKLEKPEWQTIMQLADGDRALRLARTNRTYAAGTPLLSAVNDLARTMGLSVSQSEISKIGALQTQLSGARVVQGSTRDAMSRLLSPFGINWSVQNGRLQLQRDQDVTDGEAVVISQDTGMIGTPEYTSPSKDGRPPQLKIRMLLYPQLQAGRLIEVYSRDIKGKHYKIQKVTHKGDTHGTDWFSNIDAIPATPGALT